MKYSDVGGPQLRQPNVVARGLKTSGYTLAQVCLAIVLACASGFASAAEGSAGKYWAADIHQQPLPGIRLTSGLTICDEVLWMGRWVNRYWLSTGMIEPEFHLASQEERREGLPIDGFQLAVEGQDLSGTWTWVKAEKSEVQNPDGLLVTLELASRARPITVKIHTLLIRRAGDGPLA